MGAVDGVVRVLLMVVLGTFVAGCAVGNTHRYDLGDASLDLKSDKAVAVTTVDIRPSVRTGDKSPDFVGLMRGGFGNPFDITTDSGRPLADDVTRSVVASLKSSNVNAREVVTPPNTTLQLATETLLMEDADRFALLIITAWSSDTYVNTGLTYDLKLRVLEKDGSVAAVTDVSGHDNLGTSGVPADARVNTENAFRKKLETMFGEASIKQALQ